jgi:membrane dipeptidase
MNSLQVSIFPLPDNKSKQHNTSKQPDCFPVFDGHVDLVYMMMTRQVNIDFLNLSECQITSDRLIKGHVRIIVSAFYCQDKYNGPATSVDHLNLILLYSKHFLRGLCHIKNACDLKRIFYGNKKTGAIFLLENADALIDMDICAFIDEGFKVVGLTHAGRNRIADGNNIAYPKGLTNAGKKLVKKLEQHNIIIDVAHLAEPGFWELISIVEGPIISSHTGFKACCDKPRNLSDEQLKVIIERKGMIGISVNPEMLSIHNNATIHDLFMQIDRAVQKFGTTDFFGIGSDFGGFDIENKGLDHPGLFGNLAEIFNTHGYSKKNIAAIMGENWYRFYSSHL